jgi:hypothetical protein
MATAEGQINEKTNGIIIPLQTNAPGKISKNRQKDVFFTALLLFGSKNY